MELDPQVVQFQARQGLQGFPSYIAAGIPGAREVSRDVTRWRGAADGDADAVASVETIHIPSAGRSIPARVYRPHGEPLGVITYLHGGGFVVGDLDTCDWQCRAMAARVGAVIVSVDYCLAPEQPFPAAVEESYEAASWVARNRAELGGSARLPQVVAGDSAGGNLAATVSTLARERGDLDLDLQVLIYPMLDPQMTFPSIVENGAGYMLDHATLEWFWRHYLAASYDTPPLAALPLTAQLHGLPPTFVVTAGFDPLRDEGEEYARRLEAAGVATTSLRFGSLVHGFFGWGAHVDAAQVAVSEICAAVRAELVSAARR